MDISLKFKLIRQTYNVDEECTWWFVAGYQSTICLHDIDKAKPVYYVNIIKARSFKHAKELLAMEIHKELAKNAQWLERARNIFN